MAREAEEDRLACQADGCEEVTRYHLESDEQHRRGEDTHRADGLCEQFGVMREEQDHPPRHELPEQEHAAHNHRGADGSQFERAQHTVVLPGAVVVANDRLHTLVESHDDHCEHEDEPVDYAVGGNSYVTSVRLELVVEDDHHKAMGDVHQERRQLENLRAQRRCLYGRQHRHHHHRRCQRRRLLQHR